MKKIYLLLYCTLAVYIVEAQILPDPSFSDDGYAYTNFVGNNAPERPSKILTTSDGRTLVIFNISSNLFFARYNSDGSLDAGFGTNGFKYGGRIYNPSATILPDNKIVVTGYFSEEIGDCTIVLRFNADCTPDNTFDGDGRAVLNVSESSESGDAIAVQPDGKIVVSGHAFISAISNSNFFVARFNTNGTLDNTFHSDGLIVGDESMTGSAADVFQANAIAIQPDGKIVTGGSVTISSPFGSSQDFAAMRFTTTGQLDDTFDGDGWTTIDLGPNSGIAFAVSLQADGKIVLAGSQSVPETGTNDMAVARLNSNGSLDGTFGEDGKKLIDFSGANDYATCLLILPGGGILLGGLSATSGSDDFTFALLNSAGDPNNSFSDDGMLVLPISSSNDVCRSLALSVDGKILAVGNSINTTVQNDDISIVKLNTNGTPDVSFDGDGIRSDYYPTNNNHARASALQPDGKLIVVGLTTLPDYTANIIVSRFNTNGTPDNTFGGTGVVTFSLGTSQDPADIVVQADGKIVIFGHRTLNADFDLFLLRLNDDGTRDDTFDGDGMATTPASSGQFITPTAMTLQQDGKILIAGYSRPQDVNMPTLFVSRYKNDGSPDETFDGDGSVVVLFSSAASPYDELRKISVQPNGKIVVGGTFGNQFAFARYNADGSIDNSFDGDGEVIYNFGNTTNNLTGMAIQSDGKIVFTGNSYLNNLSHVAIGRLNSNGTPDAGFNEDGFNAISVGQTDVRGMQLQADGKILIGGSLFLNTSSNHIIMRFNPNGSVDNTFDGDGLIIGTNPHMTYSISNDLEINGDKIYVVGSTFYDLESKTFIVSYKIGCSTEDCNPVPKPKANITDGFVVEGNSGTSNATMFVLLDRKHPSPVSVKYSVTHISTNSGDVVLKTGTVNFPANKQIQAIQIAVKGDRMDEFNESFRVTLSNPVNATISDGVGQCTIIDNDDAPGVYVSDTITNENKQLAKVRISLRSPSAKTVKVKFSTIDLTATSPADYSPQNNITVTFNPGQVHKYVDIVVKKDKLNEGTERFRVLLKQPENATLATSAGGRSTATITILNNGVVAMASKLAEDAEETDLKLEIKASPNPSAGEFYVTISGNSKDPIALRVIDVLGRPLVLRSKMEINTTIRIGSGWRSGVYIVEVLQGNKQRNLKLIKLN